MKGKELTAYAVSNLACGTKVYRVTAIGGVTLEEVVSTVTYNPVTRDYTDVTSNDTYYSFYTRKAIGEYDITLSDIKFCLATTLYRAVKAQEELSIQRNEMLALQEAMNMIDKS